MKRVTWQAVLFISLALVLALQSSTLAQEASGEPGVLRNPLNAYAGSDPWLQYHDGYYYLAATTWRSELVMSKSETLAGLKTAIPVQIYADTDPARCCNMWAPEFYLLENEDGELRWYFYYTAGTSGTLDNQRTHVLESADTDPMGPYTYKARIFDPLNDGWMIDGSIMQLDGALYFLFSAWVGANQSLFIAPMSNPWTLSGPRVLIAQPVYEWERIGLNVNEAPVVLRNEDRLFVVYSASHCATPDYKLGMLELVNDDPLEPNAWLKFPEPVFEQSPENGVYGPGHNGFFTSPDGTEQWMVYHANDSASGVCDNARTTRTQSIAWNADGTPDFGAPVSTGQPIAAPSGDRGIDPLPDFAALRVSRLRSMSYDVAYLRHRDVFVQVDQTVAPVADSQFYILPGLADPNAITIRSVNLPSHFLVHADNSVLFAAYDGTDAFAQNATWWVRPGLADETWISLEAYNKAGFFIGRQFGITALVEASDDMPDLMRLDATFLIEEQ